MSNHCLYSLFNSKTKQFVCFMFDVSSIPDAVRKNMLIRANSFKELGLTDENINITRFKWIGDYDNGHLVDLVLQNKTIVTEKEIQDKYNSMFFNKYSEIDVLYQLILNSDMKTPEGIEMLSYLQKILKKKESDIEFFKNSDLHIWESIEETQKKIDDAFKV